MVRLRFRRDGIFLYRGFETLGVLKHSNPPPNYEFMWGGMHGLSASVLSVVLKLDFRLSDRWIDLVDWIDFFLTRSSWTDITNLIDQPTWLTDWTDWQDLTSSPLPTGALVLGIGGRLHNSKCFDPTKSRRVEVTTVGPLLHNQPPTSDTTSVWCNTCIAH